MNQLTRQAIFWASVALLALPAVVQAQFILSTNNGQIAITGYTGSGGAVSIPSTTNGLPVTSIGEKAFWQCYSLTSVTIPSSVTSIGHYAFYDCSSLTGIAVNADNPAYSSVDGVLFDKSQNTLIQYPEGKAGTCYEIPTSLASIGIDAFSGCGKLTNVSISSSVINIDYFPFLALTNLTGIAVNASNPVYSSVDGVLFNKIKTRLIKCPQRTVGDYTITNSVTCIGDYAFYLCNSLTNIIIPTSVTCIGRGAFFGCTSLANVTIPSSVTNIDDIAFADCTSLTNVTIPSSVIRIGDGAFECCTNLTSVLIPNVVTRINSWVFGRCIRLTHVTIPSSVTSISSEAFRECNSLTSMTIPRGVTNIDYSAFADCASLTGIAVSADNPVYSSVDGVLFDKSQTTLIQYPRGKSGSRYAVHNGVISIDSSAFNNCSSLTNVTIPSSVTRIGYSAFQGCSRLISVTIPSSVTRIGDAAFGNCPSLTSVTISDSVTRIGESAFIYCCGLVNIVIGTNVTRIGSAAFWDCTRLTSVTIPNSVTYIGRWALSGCTNLSGVYFKGNAPHLEEDVFDRSDKATIYYFPGTTGWSNTFGGRPTAIWKPETNAPTAGVLP